MFTGYQEGCNKGGDISSISSSSLASFYQANLLPENNWKNWINVVQRTLKKLESYPPEGPRSQREEEH